MQLDILEEYPFKGKENILKYVFENIFEELNVEVSIVKDIYIENFHWKDVHIEDGEEYNIYNIFYDKETVLRIATKKEIPFSELFDTVGLGKINKENETTIILEYIFGYLLKMQNFNTVHVKDDFVLLKNIFKLILKDEEEAILEASKIITKEG